MAKATWPRFEHALQAAVYRAGIVVDIDRLAVRVGLADEGSEKHGSLQAELDHERFRLGQFDAWLRTCKLFAVT
jgi:hypothetical protein